MGKKKTATQEQIVCKSLRTSCIEIVDQKGAIRRFIETSSKSGMPCISLFGENLGDGQSISISIGQAGHGSIGIAGKNNLIVGPSAFADGRRAVFVHDDSNHEVFAAGIDINGERFVELLAEDGKKIWEVRGKPGESKPSA